MTAEPEGKKAQLAFSVLKNGKEVTNFRVKNRYVFVLGDNWSGAKDSRHFGPLPRANITGRAFMTLWGTRLNDKGKKKLDWGRIVRFVR
jgi:type IV secretory pathway protease TraF